LTQISIGPRVVSQEIDGEAIVLNLDSSRFFGLDEVGTRMFQLVRDFADPEQVLSQLLTEYDADEATLRRDLGVFLDELTRSGILTAAVD
jgi:hypothetical protein